MKTFKTKWLLAGVLLASALGAQAKYNGEDRGRPVLPAERPALWLQECSGCHMAFAPGLLPAASWRKLMAGLDKHFGTDAALASKDNDAITDYLMRNASNRWTANTAPLRITEGEWFQVKHSARNIAPAVWQRAAVKTRSNCAACHRGAEQGDFDERGIQIPQ